MTAGVLEHINITVSDPAKTAARLCALFGWKVRWSGSAINGGHTVHVGGENSYLAVYTKGSPTRPNETSSARLAGLNHVGVVVEDLGKVEKEVIKSGFEIYNFGEYEPGRRFYFRDPDDIEFEVVSYQLKPQSWKHEFFKRLGAMAEFGSLQK